MIIGGRAWRAASMMATIVFSVLLCRPTQGFSDDLEESPFTTVQREVPRGLIFKDRIEPHWFAKGDRFWYRNDLAGGAREFIVADAVKGERKLAFDHAKLAARLAESTGSQVAADHLPIDAIMIEDEGAIRFEAGGKGWRYNSETDKLVPAEPPSLPPVQTDGASQARGGRRRQGSPRSDTSPDGRWVTFLKDQNVHLRPKEGGSPVALSTDGTEEDGYEARVYWSPDSKKFVAMRTAKAETHKVYLIETSPRTQVQPKLHSHDYLKPGDRIAISKPHLFDVATSKEILIKDALFPNPWSIEEVRWSQDSSRFTFLYNERGHQAMCVIAVDAVNGEAKGIVDERSKTFIDYSNKTFLQFFDKTNEILWMSERDGWNHLYLIDATTGAVKNAVTKGDWLVRSVDRVDEAARQVWFRAGAIRPGQDPYHVHFARVNFDGTGLVILTEGDGTHDVRFSPDRRFLIDTYSRVDMPPIHELRRVSDGSRVCELDRADVTPLQKRGWKAPERFVAKGRDGTTDIHGIIVRPTSFDPFKKYPIIEQIYAGPQGAFVPKAFSAAPRFRSLADAGFIVVQIDGMGTNWRSKAFHDVCWKNLADAGFPDRISWMKAAAAKDPSMDLSRVGVFGGSAGGQNALGALLWHGDFYKAAVADCGCHDNRMDKIWWNEAWMGWPIGPHYAESSNVANASKLKGKLLLMVGEMDHNVDPASTMQVVNALIKADKDFDLIVFPGADHGAGGGPYGQRRLREFFVRHLQSTPASDQADARTGN